MDRNKSRSRSTLVIGGLVALAVGALAAPRHVRAQEVSAARVRYDFQSVGFVHGQTIRVSVASLIPPPIGDLPPPVPDRVRVFVLDARGERLADSGPVLFPPGPTFVFDVPRAKLGPNGEDATGRLQVRVVVIVSNAEGFPPGPSVPGVELIATATGRTEFALYPPGPTRF